MEGPLWARLGLGVGLAATLAYLSTPVAIAAARRLAFYDIPVGYKGHSTPTPYLGGAAVVAAFALAVLIAGGQPARTLPLLGAVAVLFVLGTIDDRRSLSPSLRIAVELAIGIALAAAGLGWKLGGGGVLDGLVTAVWVVAVVNAFNLFDNMDGAASTMGLVVGAGICVLGLVTSDAWVVAGSAALCGACIGFLPHNLSSPARIFLGDGGSMPLGLIVAALVMRAAHSAESSSLSLLVGFLLVGIPALDTCLVIVSRWRRRVPIMTGGRDHLTHRTRVRLRSPRRVALVLGSTQALLSALVIVASRHSRATLVYIVLAFSVCAVATIVGLEDAVPRSRAEGEMAVVSRSAHPRRLWSIGALLLIGLGSGLSALFSAYYSPGVWVPMALLMVIAGAAAMIARPPRLSAPMLLVIAGLAGIGAWSLLSSTWANAAEQATVTGNLWLSYTAFVLLLFVLLRRRHGGVFLLSAIGVGIAVVAASVVVRMLGTHPGALFLGGRLNSPLGYINGEGCVFAIGAFLALALAERRESVVAGLGSAAAVACASLALLSQSRGTAIAALVALLVLLCAVPDRRRRVLALAAIAVGIAAAASSVLRVYTQAHGAVAPPSVIHSAAGTILLASVVTGAVWGALVALSESLMRGSAAAFLQRCASVLAVILVALPIALGLIRITSIRHTVSRQWHAFVHLSESATPGASSVRLFSGGGNRYDYWRVAWHTFLDHPLIGVGAGNYAQSYFRSRHTTEPIENPHSVELQMLSELGLVGGVLFAVFLAGAVLGFVRLRQTQTPAGRTLLVAATGAAVVWLLDSSGDWMHLLPGVAAIGLCAIAVLCTHALPAPFPAAGVRERPKARLLTLAAGALAAFILAVAGATLLRSGLTQRYVDDARAELRSDPAAAIVDAGRANQLDGANLEAYYLKAAGQARFNRAGAARATLLAAAREDPQDFVTWTLLGDLEVRAGDLRAAKLYYRQAHRLNPADRAIASLAANPARATRGLSR